jgi:hypothetical protein
MSDDALEKKQKNDVEKKDKEGWAVVFAGFISVINTAVKTFGWHGTLLVLGFYALQTWGTNEQKQSFVDAIFLGKATNQLWTNLLLGVIFALVLGAVIKLYSNRIKELEDEIKSLSSTVERLKERVDKKKK